MTDFKAQRLAQPQLIRLWVEQKLKRHCSLDYIRLECIVTAGPGNASLRPVPPTPGHDGRSRSEVTLRLFLIARDIVAQCYATKAELALRATAVDLEF